MGTRSLTFVHDQYNGKEFKCVNMYRQYDGYPTGHGAELAEFLVKTKKTGYNGINDLAALMVAHFKTGPYNIYLYPTETTDCGQDYEYHIFETENVLNIRVYDCGCNMFGETQDDTYRVIFQGSLKQFTEFCKEKELA
jgi:hypothetical protein